MSDVVLPKWIFNKNPPNNICVKSSVGVIAELKKYKGEDSWVSLLLDGARYRGTRILAPIATEEKTLFDNKEALKFNEFIRQTLADRPYLFDLFHKLGRSVCALEVYEYLLWANKPMTVDDIVHSGVSSSRDSVFRVIKKLREMGLVACAAIKQTHHEVKNGGPRPLLWVAV